MKYKWCREERDEETLVRVGATTDGPTGGQHNATHTLSLSLSIRVSGASSVGGFGEGFPRSGTPPPSKRGPDSGLNLGVGSPMEEREMCGASLGSIQSKLFLFFFFFFE
ncbi:hypothetical protein HanIR_Chr12g0574771 [Helianthus annuus]|nr:hypothetical protein HanIR_Chr12g0574771 [Helianthus annuus]